MSIFKQKKVTDVDYVEEEHGSVYTFFSTFWTHILQIMATNMLTVVFNIPAMVIAYFYTVYFLPKISSNLEIDNFVNYMVSLGIYGQQSLANDIAGEDAAYQLYFLLVLCVVMFFVSSCLICVGPFQAGFSQIYRHIRRQSGISVFQDFKQGVAENVKQSLGAMLVSLVVTAVCLLAIGFYVNLGTAAGWFIGTLFIVLLVVFMFIQNLVYQIMVSRSLPLRKIYRNAFIFFLLSFGTSAVIVILDIILCLVVPFILLMYTSYLTLGLYVFLYLFIMIAFVQYMNAYYAGGLIRKYMPSADTEEGGGSDDGKTADDVEGSSGSDV